jgi:hypothetical protein
MKTRNDSKGDRNMRTYGIALATGAAAAALAASNASAATIIVGPGDSIQAAVDAALTGDTVKILDGRYNENVVVVGKKVKLQGQSKTGVILDGAGLSGDLVSFGAGADGSSVKNLTLVFAAGSGVAAASSGGVAAEGLIVRGVRVHPVYNATAAPIVKGVTARGNFHRILVTGTGGTVSGNKVYRCDGGIEANAPAVLKSNVVEDVWVGIQAYGSSVTSDRNSVRRAGANGIDLNSTGASSYKDKARSVRGHGIVINSPGSSTSVIDGPAVKNCASTGVLTYGNDVDILLGKMDNCNLAIGGSANNSKVSGNVIKNGVRGIRVSGYGIVVDNNSMKNLLGHALEGSGGVDAHHNTVEAAGDPSYGALHFNYTNGRVYSNVIGDVDGGGPAISLYRSNMTVGGYDAGYPAGNVITGVTGSAVTVEGGSYNWYYSEISLNSIDGCGDLDSGGIHITTGNTTVKGNAIANAGGSGIVLQGDVNSGWVYDNVITAAGTNGILVAQGVSYSYECSSGYYNEWGYAPYYDEYSSYYCTSYGYVATTVTPNAIIIDGNVITGSGTEGFENHGTNILVRDNVVSGSGIYDFTNDGTINVLSSTGNSPDTGDWSTVPGAVQFE